MQLYPSAGKGSCSLISSWSPPSSLVDEEYFTSLGLSREHFPKESRGLRLK